MVSVTRNVHHICLVGPDHSKFLHTSITIYKMLFPQRSLVQKKTTQLHLFQRSLQKLLPNHAVTPPTEGSSFQHCPNCGNQYWHDALFCRKCGRRRARNLGKSGKPFLRKLKKEPESLGNLGFFLEIYIYKMNQIQEIESCILLEIFHSFRSEIHMNFQPRCLRRFHLLAPRIAESFGKTRHSSVRLVNFGFMLHPGLTVFFKKCFLSGYWNVCFLFGRSLFTVQLKLSFLWSGFSPQKNRLWVANWCQLVLAKETKHRLCHFLKWEVPLTALDLPQEDRQEKLRDVTWMKEPREEFHDSHCFGFPQFCKHVGLCSCLRLLWRKNLQL